MENSNIFIFCVLKTSLKPRQRDLGKKNSGDSVKVVVVYPTEVSAVDGIEDSPMYLVESVTGINGKLPDLLIVVRVGVVSVALKGGDVGAADVVLHYVGPQPQLGVGVEGVAQDRDRVQPHHEVPDVLHLRLREGLRATVSLRAFVVTHARLPVVEAPVPVGIHPLAAQDGAVV